jgi:hypothetical protein
MIVCLLSILNPPQTVVSVFPNFVQRSFVPEQFFGAAIDGSDQGSVSRTFRPRNLAAMKSTGLVSLTYRLRTELAGEAWHWNPAGTWSEAGKKQGYWTGSSDPATTIGRSWGYRLPRRGNTFDQANNDGYSRIDDGDDKSFWKSNPYLDPFLSGDRRVPPQWVVIDLKHHLPVNAIWIQWANPYASRFRVEYWQGDEDINDDDSPAGQWRTFPKGSFEHGQGGNQLVDLGGAARPRFLRLRLLGSSHTSAGRDPRDRMGYAIREIGAGVLVHGRFRDWVRHVAKNTQTPIYASSTDPWHRSTDLDPNTEQPGFDTFFKSGLSAGRPVLVPSPLLYDTPENAAAEIRWLRSKGYPIRGIEMGEEPDGQCVDPEHYAALYELFARQIRKVDPQASFGGPCFQTVETTYAAWPDRRPKSWMRRFIDAMRSRRTLGDLGFFSFEWYPFDHPSKDSSMEVRRNPVLLREAMARLEKDGLSRKIPWLMTEYGYSAFSSPSEMDLQAGLVNLDTVGQFLEMGGDAAFLYGFPPGSLDSDGQGQWGDLMTWLADERGDAKYPLPTYWAARLMTREWCAKGSLEHRLVKSTCGDPSVAAYALVRPDGLLSLLLLNKDSRRPRTVALNVGGTLAKTGRYVQYGRKEYAWHAAGAHGHPVRSLPPRRGAFNGTLTLPPYSITVARVLSSSKG